MSGEGNIEHAIGVEYSSRAADGLVAELADRRLRLAGWTPIRVTWRDIDEEPDRLGTEAARPHQRTSCHSMTPRPLSSWTPPGSAPENEPKGWR